MTKSAEHLREADECKRWAETTRNREHRERWLQLAANWLKLAQEAAGEAQRFTIYNGGAVGDQARRVYHPINILA